MAGACDVQLDGSAEDVFVTSGSIVTLTGQVQNLSVSQSAQINLSGNAEAGSAVFENCREGMPDDECVCIAGKIYHSNAMIRQGFLEFPYNANREHNLRIRITLLGEELRNRTRHS